MPPKSRSPEHLENIKKFRKKIIGSAYFDKFYGKSYFGMIYLDYKGTPCGFKDHHSKITFRMRPTKKGFVLYSHNGNYVIQHDQLLTGELPGSETKTPRPPGNTKIVRGEAFD